MWLASLPRFVAELAQTWGLTVGQPLRGGTEALVVEATRADGRAAVLKICPPGLALGELHVLLAARGRGYAEVYAHDTARSAMLLERLGPPLAALGWPVDAQLAALCGALAEAWAAPLPDDARMTGAEKAGGLATFIERTWLDLGRPCAAAVVEAALRHAEDRRRAYDPRAAVLGHGDAHAHNALLVPGSEPPRFKFVDPDGLWIERAYDLGVALRELTPAQLGGDSAELGAERCRLIAALAGVDPAPVWQWGFIERTSTGLHCMQIGIPGGREMLGLAERWAGLDPGAL